MNEQEKAEEYVRTIPSGSAAKYGDVWTRTDMEQAHLAGQKAGYGEALHYVLTVMLTEIGVVFEPDGSSWVPWEKLRIAIEQELKGNE
jgi:hypothetical protein